MVSVTVFFIVTGLLIFEERISVHSTYYCEQSDQSHEWGLLRLVYNAMVVVEEEGGSWLNTVCLSLFVRVSPLYIQ